MQIAVKNNVDVFYFAVLVPVHVLFAEDGLLEKKVYLSTWSEIPQQNEYQTSINGVPNVTGKAQCMCYNGAPYHPHLPI